MTVAPDAPPEAQTTDTVLMVRPLHFASNAETLATNAFQTAVPPGEEASVRARAAQEFEGLRAALEAHGVRVIVVDDTPSPATPDAVFPNNWVSFHADGSVVLYPLLAPSRQAEVRTDILDALAGSGLFRPRRVVDLRQGAPPGEVLEGTGSLVLDRTHRCAYANLSPRTSPATLDRFCRVMGYRPVAFSAADAQGLPIYHTNVLMAVGTRVAVVCAEAVRDAGERRTLVRSLEDSGHAVVPIDLEQMSRFLGNLLELRARGGGPLFVMSEQARRALRPAQEAALERLGRIVSAPLDTIEACGGGSARCMLAEVFPSRD